jgi:hypothetical protein
LYFCTSAAEFVPRQIFHCSVSFFLINDLISPVNHGGLYLPFMIFVGIHSSATARKVCSHEWCKETEREPSGIMDTLLQEPDIIQHGDIIISFSAGEGNRPLGLFIDKYSEFLSFPTIYCGKTSS